jgi:hypothetical protein
MSEPGTITPVIFRADRNKRAAVTAVFPTLPWNRYSDTYTCYAHVGQHSSCSLDWYRKTRPAKPHEYVHLKRELEHYGYTLQICQKMTPQHREAFEKALDRK